MGQNLSVQVSLAAKMVTDRGNVGAGSRRDVTNGRALESLLSKGYRGFTKDSGTTFIVCAIGLRHFKQGFNRCFNLYRNPRSQTLRSLQARTMGGLIFKMHW